MSANGAPILIRKALGNRWEWPVDAGVKLDDGNSLLGSAKTWRGLIASVCITAGIGFLLGFGPQLGGRFAMLAMMGDLSASFCKRRVGKAESTRARGLDTLPESLLPLWALKNPLGLSGLDIAFTVGLFFLIEEFVSPLLYKWHIRQQPY